VLLCDEATSALDSTTEQALMRQINELGVGRTTVLIAHRLSTVQHADEICVMDKGRVVERGTHAELMGTGGSRYAQMWDTQRSILLEGGEGGASTNTSSSS
jgi:ABC-type multidrug transport system fused ATPase/permease subunit